MTKLSSSGGSVPIVHSLTLVNLVSPNLLTLSLLLLSPVARNHFDLISRTLTLLSSHPHYRSLLHSHSLTLSLTHSLTLSPTLSLSKSLSHSLTFSLSLSPSHSPSHSLSISHSLALS